MSTTMEKIIERSILYEETRFGFIYGNLHIERCCSDKEKGWVVVYLSSDKESIQVYCTRTGKVTITREQKEKRKVIK